jgi:hypothetical protein
MNNFNFGEVLTRAWQNIWKHKVLWIFGILASCARGGGGGSGGGGNSGYQTGSGDAPFSGGQFEEYANQAGKFFEQNWWIFVVIGVAIILFALISYALGMIGRVGMIKGTALAENGVESISFGEVWSESLPYFWRVFGLNFFLGLAIFLIVIPFGVFGVVTAGIGLLCLLPLMCVLIPVGWILSIVIEQAQAAIVLEDISMVDGFKRGWEIVKSNPMPTLVMSLILGIGSGVIGIVIAIPVLLAFIPTLLGMAALKESFTPLYISLACCALYMPVLILLNGVLTAYIQSAWALTYMKLSPPSKPEEPGTPAKPYDPDATVIAIEANA